MRLWVLNAYLVLLWNRALAYPRALLPSGGPLSREFWQLTTPLRQSSCVIEKNAHILWCVLIKLNVALLDKFKMVRCDSGNYFSELFMGNVLEY